MFKNLKIEFLWAGHQGEHHWWRVLAIIAFIAIIAVAIAYIGQKIILTPILASLDESQVIYKSVLFSAYLSTLFGGVILALFLGVKLIHKRSISTLFQSSSKFNTTDFIFGFLTYAALMIAVSLLFDFQETIDAVKNKGFLILLYTAIPFLIAFIIQASAEELILRGYIPQILTRALSRPIISMLTSSIIFAFFHLGYGLESFIVSLLFACTFSYVVLLRGNLSEVCGGHAANNFLIAWLLSSLSEASEGTGLSIDLILILKSLIVLVLFVCHRQCKTDPLTTI
jgi:membrane protease YdiL (CAAX protease family)